MERLSLSARAYDRILKVARTIADLAGRDGIAPAHVTEAVHYSSFGSCTATVVRTGRGVARPDARGASGGMLPRA